MTHHLLILTCSHLYFKKNKNSFSCKQQIDDTLYLVKLEVRLLEGHEDIYGRQVLYIFGENLSNYF